MYIALHAFALTVNASGDATVYSAGPAMGLVRQITYVPDATVPLDTGADLVITGEASGVAIATLSNIGTSTVSWAPRQPTHSTAGAASLFAAAGQAVNDHIALGGERIKVVVAQGGNAKTGTLSITVG